MTQNVHVDIDHIATLSRLAISAEEKTVLAGQLDSIASFMSDIQSVDTSNISLASSNHRNVFVADVATEDSGAKTRALVDSAPEKSGDFVVVPQVISGGKHS